MMSSSKANIDTLNQAIDGIVQDAGNMHELIKKSTAELKRATNAGKKMANEAAHVADGLAPLSKQLESERKDTSAMLDETKAQRAALIGTMEQSFEAARKERNESFEAFSSKSLGESEKTRDALQSDFLSFKTTTGARIDSLEAQLAKLNGSAESLGAKVEEVGKSADTAEKKLLEQVETVRSKLLIPLYVAIGIGAANLVCLVLLLLR